MLSLKINIRQISLWSQLLIRKILSFIHCLMYIYYVLHLTSVEKKQKHISKVIINISDSLLSLTIISVTKKSKISKSTEKSKRRRKSTTVSSTIKRSSIIKRGSIIKKDSIIKKSKIRSSK